MKEVLKKNHVKKLALVGMALVIMLFSMTIISAKENKGANQYDKSNSK
ncbi:MAG: hypothetical protein K1W40_17075 [Schaedlerella sp.]|nr:hypothetical protein [uncultured Schaedlerella sp.]